MNLFCEVSLSALMQMVDEQEEKEKILISQPEHWDAILYGLCYKRNKGIIAFARRKCVCEAEYFLMSAPTDLTALTSTGKHF